jgi:hypothetical protein
MRKGGRPKNKRITRVGVFLDRVSRQVVRVMASSKLHKNFGDMLGTIVVRPFQDGGEWVTLAASNELDVAMKERGYVHVRPSDVAVIRGDLKKSPELAVGVDAGQAIAKLALQKDPADIHQDTDGQDERSLEGLMGNLPMFKDELPLVEQVMVNCGNTVEPSPIVHPEIAGRGVECAHGRAAWK